MGTKHDRGVRAEEPTRPGVLYKKFWTRSVPNALAARVVLPVIQGVAGADKARGVLNSLAGEAICFVDERLVPQFRSIGTYAFIILPGGCAWALEKHEGCTFCPFQPAVDGYVGNLPLGHAEFMNLFRAGFRTVRGASAMINVFTAGSFLNGGEIPASVQEEIARDVGRDPGARILRVESRLEYIREETVQPVVAALGGKTLDVAIGFETQDDTVRNRLLQKGMSRDGLSRAIDTLHRCGARASVYLMHKPHPIMSEGWAIEEAKASIWVAFGSGADEVLLQATYITDPDPTGEKKVKNHLKRWRDTLGFEPPSLWSIVEVLRETAGAGPVMLGKWEDEIPPPVAAPDRRNCEGCRAGLMERIVKWRRTLDQAVFDPRTLPACGCRGEWEKETADRNRPAEERFNRDEYIPRPMTAG